MKFCNSFSPIRYLNENERYKTNTNLFMNINNNTAPFVLIIWHQKEPLGCVVYSHYPTNDSYSKCKNCYCLRCNYVTKLLGILQRVIRSQKVCISFVHSKNRSFFSQESLWLNVQTCFLKIRPYQCTDFKKKIFLLCPSEEMPPHLKLHTETFSYFVKWFYFLINVLRSKQNKTPKIDPKMLKQ